MEPHAMGRYLETLTLELDIYTLAAENLTQYIGSILSIII
jgi:hypothetical protein